MERKESFSRIRLATTTVLPVEARQWRVFLSAAAAGPGPEGFSSSTASRQLVLPVHPRLVRALMEATGSLRLAQRAVMAARGMVPPPRRRPQGMQGAGGGGSGDLPDDDELAGLTSLALGLAFTACRADEAVAIDPTLRATSAVFRRGDRVAVSPPATGTSQRVVGFVEEHLADGTYVVRPDAEDDGHGGIRAPASGRHRAGASHPAAATLTGVRPWRMRPFSRLVQRAVDKGSNGFHRVALLSALHALQQEPNSVAALRIACPLLLRMSRPAEAASLAHRLVQLRPHEREGHFALGMASAALNRLRPAVFHLRCAVHIDPTCGETLQGLWQAEARMRHLVAQRTAARQRGLDGAGAKDAHVPNLLPAPRVPPPSVSVRSRAAATARGHFLSYLRPLGSGGDVAFQRWTAVCHQSNVTYSSQLSGTVLFRGAQPPSFGQLPFLAGDSRGVVARAPQLTDAQHVVSSLRMAAGIVAARLLTLSVPPKSRDPMPGRGADLGAGTSRSSSPRTASPRASPRLSPSLPVSASPGDRGPMRFPDHGPAGVLAAARREALHRPASSHALGMDAAATTPGGPAGSMPLRRPPSSGAASFRTPTRPASRAPGDAHSSARVPFGSPSSVSRHVAPPSSVAGSAATRRHLPAPRPSALSSLLPPEVVLDSAKARRATETRRTKGGRHDAPPEEAARPWAAPLRSTGMVMATLDLVQRTGASARRANWAAVASFAGSAAYDAVSVLSASTGAGGHWDAAAGRPPAHRATAGGFARYGSAAASILVPALSAPPVPQLSAMVRRFVSALPPGAGVGVGDGKQPGLPKKRGGRAGRGWPLKPDLFTLRPPSSGSLRGSGVLVPPAPGPGDLTRWAMRGEELAAAAARCLSDDDVAAAVATWRLRTRGVQLWVRSSQRRKAKEERSGAMAAASAARLSSARLPEAAMVRTSSRSSTPGGSAPRSAAAVWSAWSRAKGRTARKRMLDTQRVGPGLWFHSVTHEQGRGELVRLFEDVWRPWAERAPSEGARRARLAARRSDMVQNDWRLLDPEAANEVVRSAVAHESRYVDWMRGGGGAATAPLPSKAAQQRRLRRLALEDELMEARSGVPRLGRDAAPDHDAVLARTLRAVRVARTRRQKRARQMRRSIDSVPSFWTGIEPRGAGADGILVAVLRPDRRAAKAAPDPAAQTLALARGSSPALHRMASDSSVLSRHESMLSRVASGRSLVAAPDGSLSAGERQGPEAVTPRAGTPVFGLGGGASSPLLHAASSRSLSLLQPVHGRSRAGDRAPSPAPGTPAAQQPPAASIHALRPYRGPGGWQASVGDELDASREIRKAGSSFVQGTLGGEVALRARSEVALLAVSAGHAEEEAMRRERADSGGRHMVAREAGPGGAGAAAGVPASPSVSNPVLDALLGSHEQVETEGMSSSSSSSQGSSSSEGSFRGGDGEAGGTPATSGSSEDVRPPRAVGGPVSGMGARRAARRDDREERRLGTGMERSASSGEHAQPVFVRIGRPPRSPAAAPAAGEASPLPVGAAGTPGGRRVAVVGVAPSSGGSPVALGSWPRHASSGSASDTPADTVEEEEEGEEEGEDDEDDEDGDEDVGSLSSASSPFSDVDVDGRSVDDDDADDAGDASALEAELLEAEAWMQDADDASTAAKRKQRPGRPKPRPKPKLSAAAGAKPSRGMIRPKASSRRLARKPTAKAPMRRSESRYKVRSDAASSRSGSTRRPKRPLKPAGSAASVSSSSRSGGARRGFAGRSARAAGALETGVAAAALEAQLHGLVDTTLQDDWDDGASEAASGHGAASEGSQRSQSRSGAAKDDDTDGDAEGRALQPKESGMGVDWTDTAQPEQPRAAGGKAGSQGGGGSRQDQKAPPRQAARGVRRANARERSVSTGAARRGGSRAGSTSGASSAASSGGRRSGASPSAKGSEEGSEAEIGRALLAVTQGMGGATGGTDLTAGEEAGEGEDDGDDDVSAWGGAGPAELGGRAGSPLPVPDAARPAEPADDAPPAPDPEPVRLPRGRSLSRHPPSGMAPSASSRSLAGSRASSTSSRAGHTGGGGGLRRSRSGISRPKADLLRGTSRQRLRPVAVAASAARLGRAKPSARGLARTGSSARLSSRGNGSFAVGGSRPEEKAEAAARGDGITTDADGRALLREPVVSEAEAFRFNAIALATARPVPRVLNLATIDSQSRTSVLAFYLGGEYDRGVRLACKLTPAILFDVDDTALSAFHAMADTGFTAVPSLLPHFFLSANAPAIEPVLQLYRHARALGLVPIFVSERPPEARKATLEALNRAGFTGFRHLITRGPALPGGGETATAGQFKYEVRYALMRRGFRIVCVVGDQDHDFAGGLAGDFQCKLPNMLYETM